MTATTIDNLDAEQRQVLRREARIEYARRSFLGFARQCFYEGRYRVNWHHRILANKLQTFADPDSTLRRLMVFMPPQHGKSWLTSRLLPGWILGHYPDKRIIGCSYNADLATEMSRDAKRVLKQPEYRAVFPDTQIPDRHVATDERHAHKNTATHWEIVGRNGSYRAKGAKQGVSGHPADYILIDDPLDREMARSQAERDKVYEWYKKSLTARISNEGRILLVMTRWHQGDLAGRLLQEADEIDEADDWEVVRFPALKEDQTFAGDPRKVGEALWPEQRDREELTAIKKTDPDTFSALFQQHPTPPGGTIVKAEWLENRWEARPTGNGQYVQSWDLRAGGNSGSSSFAVGQLWFAPDKEPGTVYLIDQKRGRWDINETIAQMKAAQQGEPWHRTGAVLVEQKADGRAIVPMLRGKIPGIIGQNPTGSKEARLQSVAPFFRSGSVKLPSRKVRSWAPEYVSELTRFPGCPSDDQVDATTQALRHLLINGSRQSDSSYESSYQASPV